MTSKVDIESIIKGFETGAVDYIRKPFNDLELVVRVRNHVALKKIREDLEMQFRYKDMNITITVTFGVAAYSADSTVDELINQADKALYKGKRGGRNRVAAAK